jgi:protein O-mannosyl-transferase
MNALSPSGLKYYLLIIVAIAALYSQTARFDFLTYDDYDLIYQNEAFLSPLSNIAAAFTTQVFGDRHPESVYYRPLLMVSFIVEYHLWGLNPLGYHLMNVVVHIGTTLLLFLLFQKLTGSLWTAVVGGLLFALHPVQTESVAWIAGGNDLLMGLFVVLMFYCYVSSRDETGRRGSWFALSALFFTLALFTKEAAAFYLLLLPLFDLCLNHARVKTLLNRKTLARYSCMAGILAFYVIVRLAVVGSVIGAGSSAGGTPFLLRIQEVPAIVAEYIRLLVVPSRLSIAHPVIQLPWLRAPWLWLAWGIVIGFVWVLRWTWQRDRIACFGLLWFATGLLPTLDLIPVAVPILEHRMYLPLAGLALAIARGGFLLFGPESRRPALKYLPGSVFLLLWLLSFERVSVWQNSETLWLDTIAKSPNYSRAYFNLAGYYYNLQRYAEAAGLLETYIKLKPNEFLGYSKLRETYFVAGEYGEAARVCREMIARSPRDPNRYLEASELFEHLKMPDSAVAVCRSGLAADSNLFQLHEHLGYLLAVRDSMGEAEREYQHALRLNPRYSPAYFGLGKLYALRRQGLPAIHSIEEGMQYGDAPLDVLRLLAYLYTQTGQEEKAAALGQRYNF